MPSETCKCLRVIFLEPKATRRRLREMLLAVGLIMINNEIQEIPHPLRNNPLVGQGLTLSRLHDNTPTYIHSGGVGTNRRVDCQQASEVKTGFLQYLKYVFSLWLKSME